MDNPEKLATYSIQDEENQNRKTTQYVLKTTVRKQTQITLIRHVPSYKQLEVKMNRTSFFLRKTYRTSRHGTLNIKTLNRTTDISDAREG